MINFYYYQGQLRKYMLQFCNIFVGLKVETGKGECGEPEFITVPIRIGSKDRVVAAIEAGNTQNKPFSLPSMAAAMTALRLSPNRKGTNVTDKRSYLPEGGVWPTDIRTVTRIMPIPFIMEMELSIYASNTQQLHQMLEQILMLFDPTLQIQTNDSATDWTQITLVELTDINNEENYPAGADRRVINWTFKFSIPIYISAPMDVKDDVVRKILIRIGDLDGFVLDEYDENGNLVPFNSDSLFGTVEIDATGQDVTVHGNLVQ